MTLILSEVNKRINSKWIIQSLNLSVKDGECISLLGPSGCGKSTTLRLIAGLEKPDSGKIYINNNEITNTSPVDRRIGMVFQSYALFPHLTVSQNLSLGLQVRNVNKLKIREKVKYILTLLKMNEYAASKPSQLSGGQRQRIALGRALLRDPLVYLLDEPMSNLDEQLREELRPELKRLILNGGQPVVYVTHDQQEAMAMSDKIALMNKGMIVQIGTPQELYENPKTIFAAKFIGRPQINFFPPENGLVKAIRPEDILISSDGMDSKVIYKEWLGMKQIIAVDTKKGVFRIICNPTEYVGESLKITWLKSKEKIFNKNSGERVN